MTFGRSIPIREIMQKLRKCRFSQIFNQYDTFLFLGTNEGYDLILGIIRVC